jgi:hypothetical protein
MEPQRKPLILLASQNSISWNKLAEILKVLDLLRKLYA